MNAAHAPGMIARTADIEATGGMMQHVTDVGLYTKLITSAASLIYRTFAGGTRESEVDHGA